MKKAVSTMFSFILIFAMAVLSFTTCGFAAAQPPSSVSVSADTGFTVPTFTSNENVVSGLFSLINTAKKTSVKVSQTTELMRLVFSTAVSGNQVEDVPYTVYKSSDSSLYVMKKNSLYQLDATTFYRLVDETGIGFYKYRSVPTAKIDAGGANVDLCKNSSNYQFKKLDGLLYTTKFVPDDCGTLVEDNAAIKIPKFSIEPKSVKVSVSQNSKQSSQVVWSGDISKIKDFKAEKSGDYSVKYTAAYESPHYKGDVVYSYTTKYDVRSNDLGFAIFGASTVPGEAVVLRVMNVPEDGKVTFKSDIKYTPSFFRQKNGDMTALLPISYYTAPGNYYVELGCGDASKRFTIAVGAKKFTEQYLTVPPSTAEATINSQKANDEFEKYIAPIRYVSDDKQYWSGRFIWPLKQLPRRTTEFGVIRYVNGDTKNPSRHGAIDFAAAAGTPVYAPAAGRVLYSGNLQLTGNTICIEHGYGLKTWYYHMNGRNVKTNDIVKQGQQIGIVGSTGFSTGAHLHYGMSVSNTVSGNVWINPETSVTTDLFK